MLCVAPTEGNPATTQTAGIEWGRQYKNGVACSVLVFCFRHSLSSSKPISKKMAQFGDRRQTVSFGAMG